MDLARRKAQAFGRPSKFNFLAGRRPPSRREWPLGHTQAEAQAIATANSKRGQK